MVGSQSSALQMRGGEAAALADHAPIGHQIVVPGRGRTHHHLLRHRPAHGVIEIGRGRDVRGIGQGLGQPRMLAVIGQGEAAHPLPVEETGIMVSGEERATRRAFRNPRVIERQQPALFARKRRSETAKLEVRK